MKPELTVFAGLKVAASKCGCIFPPGLPIEDWTRLGREIVGFLELSQWAIADWVNYGETVYGEKYRLALTVLRIEYGTLRNLAHVGKTIELSRRRDNLSFSHHATVACEFSLAPADQDRYLARAEKESLTRADLRELIRRDQAEVGGHAGSARLDPPGPLKYLTDFTLSLQRLGDPTGWSAPQKEAWKRELRPLVDLYESL